MRIAALLITYNPDITRFTKVIDSLISQVELILIVDNGSRNFSVIEQFENKFCHIISLDENLGIASATNMGFDYLSEHNFDFILLSDQDTVYMPDYVRKFLKFIDDDPLIAVYAPSVFDENSGMMKHVYCLRKSKIVKVIPENDSLIFQSIASGLLIKTDLLKTIGGMNDSLFIDMVDFEWCWRLNFQGFRIKYLTGLRINHSLGDNKIKVFNKYVSTRSYIRYYYIIRNSLYLSLYTRYLPKKARFYLFIDALKYFFGYSMIDFFSNKKFVHQRYFNRAIRDGIAKKLGKIEL